MSWEKKLSITPSQEWWQKNNSLAVDFTNDTKLKWFQIRFTHRLLGTNKFLFNIGVKNTCLCTFCGDEEENLCHMYWHCAITQKFWKDVSAWITQITGKSFKINLLEILFGKRDSTEIFNLLICLIKYHIYKVRLMSSVPCLHLLKREIVAFYNAEKIMYYRNCNFEKFDHRWAPMIQLIE